MWFLVNDCDLDRIHEKLESDVLALVACSSGVCVKVNFRGITKTNTFLEKMIACLNVSLEQKNEKGERLGWILKKASSTFSRLDIMLCDTLHRYNLMMQNNLSEDAAHTSALQLGELWIRDNQCFLNHLNIPGKIIRWDEWRYARDFLDTTHLVKEMVLESEQCQDIFNDCALEYLERKNIFASRRNIDLSIAYLVEECAVISLWRHKGYQVELYPGQRSRAVACFFEYLVQNDASEPFGFVKVELRKRVEHHYENTERVLV